MAEYTILTNSVMNNRSDVVIEFEVPVGDNAAGVPWRTIVAELRTEASSVVELRAEAGSVNPRKAANVAHIAVLDAGSVMELQLTVEYDANSTNAEKLTVLDAAVADEVERFTIEFEKLYLFYGYVRGS